MTYTFNPLATIPVDHTGFGIIVVLCIFIAVVILLNEAELFFPWFFVATLISVFAYFVSYSWTDQTPKTFANTQVVGELVGFQPEGYNEKSGKTRADRHYMYVVYKVDGQQIILNATTGVTYPERVTLYKN